MEFEALSLKLRQNLSVGVAFLLDAVQIFFDAVAKRFDDGQILSVVRLIFSVDGEIFFDDRQNLSIDGEKRFVVEVIFFDDEQKRLGVGAFCSKDVGN